jgi:hypothetical protein
MGDPSGKEIELTMHTGKDLLVAGSGPPRKITSTITQGHCEQAER